MHTPAFQRPAGGRPPDTSGNSRAKGVPVAVESPRQRSRRRCPDARAG